jgi:predicted ester cyclase
MPSNADRAREALSTVFGGDLDHLDRYYEDRFQDHVNTMEFSGLDGIREATALYRRLFPDLTVTVERQVSEGELVSTRWNLHGTHRDRGVRLDGVSIHRFEGEKIVECWDSFDSIELLKQLGPWRSLLMFVREWRALLSLRRAERPPPGPETA